MPEHRHRYLETPAMLEAGERARCGCGARREEPRTATVVAIDPGPERSAWVALDAGGTPLAFAREPNLDVLRRCVTDWSGTLPVGPRALVIEMVESFGMPVGAEVFETVRWAGRFEQAWAGTSPVLPVHRIGRKAVKLALCQTARAKDGNVRQALIDRFGGKDAAVGRKAAPGPLYGVSGDVWSALAVGIVWLDQQGGEIR